MEEIKLYSFKIQYIKISGQRAVWDFRRDIPELKIIASPFSSDWSKRVEEEIRVFNIWKKFNPDIPFEKLRLSNFSNQRFIVDVNLQKLFSLRQKVITDLYILVPIQYPRSLPELDLRSSKTFAEYFLKWTRHHPFCMPPIMRSLWYSKKGRAGLAHFLKILLFFITIAGRRRHNLTVSHIF